jgi:hypothetical protein
MNMITRPEQYKPELLSFGYNGVEIRNPFLAPDGQSVVDPVATYGFEEVQTGGGCAALHLHLPDGGCIVLTDSDGCGVPSGLEMCTALIGRQDVEGNELACMVLGMVPLLTNRKPVRVEVVEMVERRVTVDVLAASREEAGRIAAGITAIKRDAGWGDTRHSTTTFLVGA